GQRGDQVPAGRRAALRLGIRGAQARRRYDRQHEFRHRRGRHPRDVRLLPRRDGTLMYAGYDMTPVDAKSVRELRLEIEEFHTEYCNVLDQGALDRWVEFFAEDSLYRITARENADAGLRVGLVYAEGR